MPISCPICRASVSTKLLELNSMPASIGIQWPSRDEALSCKTGDLSLMYCAGCGFIWNQTFDASRLEYSMRYDNALDFSPVFRGYAEALAKRLIESYHIRGKRVVEIGCGKGNFLSLLCEEGENRGVGFDPSFDGDRVDGPAAGRLTFHRDFYSEKYAGYAADLICCRHVLEHIDDAVEFLAMVRRAIEENPSAILYLEVPNVRFILEKLSIWDIIYEHCSYFSRESLSYIFHRCGFDILRLEEPYGGQFLAIDASLTKNKQSAPYESIELSNLTALVERFAGQVRGRLESWHARIDELNRTAQKVVIWGGGAKAVSFLSMMKIRDEMLYVVDINPHKQGRFVGGTGQEIVSPASLRVIDPDVIILMNPIYRSEVSGQVSRMNLNARIVDI